MSIPPHPLQSPLPTKQQTEAILLLPERRRRGRMCEGRRPADAARPVWIAAAELRRREAAADARLAAARARLAEALAELERARARAAELQRRLEETYGKRRRIKRAAAAARDRIHETRARLREEEEAEQQQLPAESDPTS